MIEAAAAVNVGAGVDKAAGAEVAGEEAAADDVLEVSDFNATIAWALGIDPACRKVNLTFKRNLAM